MRVCVFVVLLLGLCVWDSADGRRTRFKPSPKPKKDKKPAEKLPPAKDVNINQMSGRWYLLSIASRCKYLLENGFKVEGTLISLTPDSPGAPMNVSTFTKHNYQCWEIQQQYETTKSSGIFLLKAKIPVKNTEVLVVDTDYSSYAIFLYKRMNQITMKLYGRSAEMSDAIEDRFEDLAKKQNLGLDTVLQFPTYGFCESADIEHVLVMS